MLSNKIIVKQINASFVKIYCSDEIREELSEHFSFLSEEAKFLKSKWNEEAQKFLLCKFDPRRKKWIPSNKYRNWDGKIRIFNKATNRLPVGLVCHLKEFCDDNNYEIEFVDLDLPEKFDIETFGEFIKVLDLPFEPYEHQLKFVYKAITSNRGTYISSTGSGKTLSAYILCQWFLKKDVKKIIIIVPSTTLVYQMRDDFLKYSNNTMDDIKIILGGETKEVDSKITISTWQSIPDMDRDWYRQFGMIIGDEAHGCSAKSLKYIIESMSNAYVRIAMTGTMNDTKVNALQIIGLFGPVEEIVKSKELILKKISSKLSIKCMVLKHKKQSKMDYHDETKFLESCKRRSLFIISLAKRLKGNTLILVPHSTNHGKFLYQLSKSKITDREIFYIDGKMSGKKRNEIRNIIDNSEDSVTIATDGTMSTGINIKNIDNMIFGKPGKNRRVCLQSIGRGLRMSERKQFCNLYDIVDDFGYDNFSKKHFMRRIEFYAEEGFPYEIFEVDI
jgi:superfamily II DNA or RNA helicase